MTFSLQTEHFSWGTCTRTVVRVTWFCLFFSPHQTQAWCKWLHVLPIAQHLVLCKSKDVRPKQNHRRLWYNHPACRSTEKRRMCFLYSKKNNIFQITTLNVIPCTCNWTHKFQSFSLSPWKGRRSKKERKREITHSCSMDHRTGCAQTHYLILGNSVDWTLQTARRAH